MAHEKWGTLSFGKQWGAYYDVAYTTDVLNAFTGWSVGAYTFGDGGLTGRAVLMPRCNTVIPLAIYISLCNMPLSKIAMWRSMTIKVMP